MAKHNDDYIPTFADIEHDRDARLKRIEGKDDPRKTYLCRFTVDRKLFEEKIVAIDLKTAEEQLKQQWGMVGMIVRDLVTTIVEETKRDEDCC